MIDKDKILSIEKALGTKLFPMVIKYLTTDDECYWGGRVCGKTTADILKMALQKDRMIELRDLKKGLYVDELHGTSYPSRFAHEFMHIRNLLMTEGLEVIKINGWDDSTPRSKKTEKL